LLPTSAVSAGAEWQVDAGPWQTNGAMVSGLSVSNHIVSFTNLFGWTTPAPQTVTISNGLTTTVTGTYVQQTGSLQAILRPTSAVSAGAEWQVDAARWQTNGAMVSGLPVGSHTITFTNLFGWTTPAPQTVTISNGFLATVTGTYVQQTGSL